MAMIKEDGSIKIPGPPGSKFTKGSFFEIDGAWYFHSGLWNLWEHFCDTRTDPPQLKLELQDWLDQYGVSRSAIEEEGILEFVFKDPEVFTLFRLTWL
jgi:hypothetical protein